MSQKRIGLIVYGLDRPLTGISRYTLELVRALGKLDPCPDITLLAAGGIGDLADEGPFPVVSLPMCRLLPGLLTIGQVALRRAVQQHQLEVVHDLTGVTPLALLPRSVKTVVTIQDVFALSIPGYSSRLDALIYRRSLPRILPRIKQIITPSQHSKHEIIEHLGVSAENIDIIPHGFSAQFQPLPPTYVQTELANRFQLNAPYILFVGNLTERKNLARALEAFAQVQSRFVDLQFVLVGPRNWKQTPIEAIVERLGISQHIRLLGSVSDEVLPLLYNGAHLFLFPSLYEGFGLPILEAMACGTPVVTSNVSSLPTVAGDAALLVDPHRPKQIAFAICSLLEDAPLHSAQRLAGLEQAQNYSWQASAEATAAIYAS